MEKVKKALISIANMVIELFKNDEIKLVLDEFDIKKVEKILIAA